MIFRPLDFKHLLLIALLPALSGCAALYGSFYTDDPLTAAEHNDLGVIYEREGKNDLALREYKRAHAIDGSLVTPLVNIGNVYMKEGEYTEAEEYYRKALEKDPMSIEAANNLANLFMTTGGNYREGLDMLLRAAGPVETAPAYALDTIGALYLRLGEKENARTYLNEACGKSSDDAELRKEIEAHLLEVGEPSGCRPAPAVTPQAPSPPQSFFRRETPGRQASFPLLSEAP